VTTVGPGALQLVGRLPHLPWMAEEVAASGTLEPSWNMFDLTPEGRDPVWDEQLRYD